MLTQPLLDSLVLKRDFQRVLSLADPAAVREFKSLKYRDHLYSLGDSLMLTTIKNGQRVNQIARLKKILATRASPEGPELPLLKVNWYCNKDDISPTYNRFKPCFSVYELFLTELECTQSFNHSTHSHPLCRLHPVPRQGPPLRGVRAPTRLPG